MPVASLKDILDPAFADRYGVAAFNVVDGVSLQAVIDAAAKLESPLIVQTSVKTVKFFGAKVLYQMFRAMADEAPVPIALHLDHCPEREWASICLRSGWTRSCSTARISTSRRTRVRQRRSSRRRAVTALMWKGRSRAQGVEDDVGSDEAGEVHPVEVSLKFIEDTGVYAFAPAIGTAHGLYAGSPNLTPERVTEMVEQRAIPMVLHGGTGLAPEQFQDLISRGCAKVNISTALKIAFVDAHREYLDANPTKQDPPALLKHVREAVKGMAIEHMRFFGSAGKARSTVNT